MRYTISQLLLLGVASAQLEIPIAKKSYRELGIEPLRRRDTTTDSTNLFEILTYSNGGAYYCNITVGTPAQAQTVIIDTGSSDLYFDASTASACQSTTASNSCRDGTYNKASSSTYKQIAASPAFNSSFGDGSTAYGPYGQDVVTIGNIAIQNMEFGVAETVDSTTGYALGLMGVGYSSIEATQPRSMAKYPNVPETLVDAGVIASRLYSVYLNDAAYESGTILFGGVDTTKYTGDLVTLNMLPEYGTNLVREFYTTVTAASATVGGSTTTIFSGGTDDVTAYLNTNNAVAGVLDTGSAAWTVPSAYYKTIVQAFNYIDSNGNAPCSHRFSGDYLTLTFGAQIAIKVPVQEFLIPLYNPSTNQPIAYDKNNQACTFLVGPSGQGTPVIGDAILRSMYVVFDLDNAQVSIAQAAVNSTASPNIVKVGTDGVAATVSGAKAAVADQSYSPAPTATATVSYIASTIASTVGTATGTQAVPNDAQTKSSAAGQIAPELGFSGVVSMAWMTIMAVAGAALLV